MPARFLFSLAVAACAATVKPPKPPRTAEDLGPAVIDVSSYPEAMQAAYRDVFLRFFGFFGTTARYVNSPIIEMDEKLEARERRDHPGLFSDPEVAEVTRDGWKRAVQDIFTRPPCCGACPFLTREEAIALRRFLVYDSIHRKTGANAPAWIARRKDLLRRFKESTRRPSP